MDELEIVKELQIMSNEFSHSSFFQHLSFTLDRASEIILNKKDCVEVVRCKDCKNFSFCYDEQESHKEDFCSYGERG